MNKKRRKQCCGYEYTHEDYDWSVTTDYVNNRIYLNASEDDEDLESARQYGLAIGRAVRDMQRDI